MVLLDLLSRLIAIVTGLLTIAERWERYIKTRKEKDPSTAPQPSDGSPCDCDEQS